MESSLTTQSAFKKLNQKLSGLMAQAQLQAEQTLKQIRVQTYWKMGQCLEDELPQDRSQHNGWFKALAETLTVNPLLLQRCWQFYGQYPKALPSTEAFQQIPWTHHVELLFVSQAKERNFYLKQIQNQAWSRDQLRQAVKQKLHQTPVASKASGKKAQLLRPNSGLHIYVAELKRIVDGDTLIVSIDLGFDVWKKQRIRIRGIDCPELKTPEGEAAKAFVQDQLKSVQFLVIKTYKVDMYYRFVADVFFDPSLTDKDQLFQKGKFLNEEILNAGHAKLMLV